MIISKIALDNVVKIVLDTEELFKSNGSIKSDIEDMITEVKHLAFKTYQQENRSRRLKGANLVEFDERLLKR